MKKLILALILASGFLSATDFSAMSTEELSAMRGTVAADEREAFRSEMQSRMSTMTPEERSALGAGTAKGSSSGKGQMLRDGSAAGSQSMGANKGGGGGRR